jgi:DNA primase
MKDVDTRMLSLDARVLLEEATAAYQAQLNEVAPYLVARGLSKEAALTHRLGYVHEPVIGHEQYAGRLSIPYITPTGVVDIRFRAIRDDDSPKYLSRSGAESVLYNVPAFELDSDYIAICEGEMDTIIASSMVGIPAVGLAGANAWKNWYSRAFMDYRKVFVLCDGDQPGRDLGKKIAQQIDVAIVVTMPDGMDVNDLYLAEGPEGILKKMGLQHV